MATPEGNLATVTSLYLAALTGFLAGQFGRWISRPRPGERAPGPALLRREARLADAVVHALLAFLVVSLARLDVGGYVVPAVTGLILAVSERLALWQWNRPQVLRPLQPATLAGVYTALFWPLGLVWTTLVLLGRRWAGRNRRRLRWLPLLQAALALASAYAWRLPDAFVIVVLLFAAQQVSQVLPHFLPAAWSAQARKRRRNGVSLTRLARTAVGFTTIFALLLYFLNLYVYHGYGAARDLIRRGEGEFRAVALTFDDGPNPRFTPQILDILDQYDVKATFFLVGQEAQMYPDLTLRIVEAGHEIGSHTYSHSNLLGARPSRVRNEIIRGNRAIEAITGQHPRYFRPPRGAYSQTVLDVVAEENQRLILFSLSSRDWLELSPNDIARNLLQRVQPGDILLLHDSGDIIRGRSGDRSNTIRALPMIIEGLQARGYSFLTVSQLLIISHLETEGITDAGAEDTEDGEGD